MKFTATSPRFASAGSRRFAFYLLQKNRRARGEGDYDATNAFLRPDGIGRFMRPVGLAPFKRPTS